MKKICLLSFASFFTVIAFAQTGKTTPGQPKVHGTVPATAVVANAKTPASATAFRTAPATQKPVAAKPKQQFVSPAKTTAAKS
jgi:hypothetical protein